MAAYSLSDRFSGDSQYFRILDPGAYQYDEKYNCTVNQAGAPFLSKTPRGTLSAQPIWTHTIYFSDWRPKIQNCTSMMSKEPRFPYEAETQELDEIICNCGKTDCCDCSEEEAKRELAIICQGKVPRYILKGVPPRTFGDSALSAPHKGHGGFQINRDGSLKKITENYSNSSPPFYETRVTESTMYYQGCKWSKRTSTRGIAHATEGPGPSDYVLNKQPNEFEICQENVRAKKRKESKQYRYIEMIQRRNILDGFPGPATYTPMLPKGTDLQNTNSKADRFPVSKYDVSPGPADYGLKRLFELPELPLNQCHAVLPQPACFGVNAKRFKIQKEEGPSPATYSTTYVECKPQVCKKAPFGSTVSRFKPTLNDTANREIKNTQENNQTDDNEACPSRTWQFKSKTVRIKPLKKIGQANQMQIHPRRTSFKKSLKLQHLAPFASSEGRFRPWFCFLPLQGRLITPGPGYYNLERPKSYPAVNRGPLYRSRRFQPVYFVTPGPNEYKKLGIVETTLATHNSRLKNNIERRHQFHYDFPPEPKRGSPGEQIDMLLQKCIAICDDMMGTKSDITSENISRNKIGTSSNVKCKCTCVCKINQISTSSNVKCKCRCVCRKKLLRYYLFKHQLMPVW